MRVKKSALPSISSAEEHKVSLLLTQSVLIGIFLGAFDITAYSLLLSTFDEKLMASGFIVSGIAGLFLTAFYLKLSTKAISTKLSTGTLIFILTVLASLWLLKSYSGQKWVIFLIFVMVAPLNILSFIGFWETSERVLKGKPDKEFRFLEGGLMAGILIVSFLIAVIMSFKIQTKNILLISILSLPCIILIQYLIIKRFDFDREPGDDSDDIIKRLPLFLRSDSYQKTLGLFVALSVLAAFIIQYLFMAAAKKQFPVSESMASFLGLFTGIMMIFNLFMKFVGFPLIQHHFRVKVSLLISPVLIAILSVLAILTGFSIDMQLASGGFMILVLTLGFNKIISRSFNDSVEIPLYKILFQSFSKKSVHEIQSYIDGILNETGYLFSGIILAGFGILSFIHLIHFSILLLVVSLIWIYTGVMLIKKYKDSLEHLTPAVLSENYHRPVPKSRFASVLEFRKNYFGFITGNYSALNEISQAYFDTLSGHAVAEKDVNLLTALRKIAGNTVYDNTMRNRSQEIIDTLSKKDVATDVGTLLLSGTRLPQTTEILRLLRNNSVESKRKAIHIIGKFRICDLLSVVCESLNNPDLSKDAYEILLSFGTGIEDELIRFYLINSGNSKLSRVILQLLGNTCSKESTGFLFTHLWSNSRQLKEVTIACLLKCKFKPSDEEIISLNNLVFDTIGIITWNLGAEAIYKHEKNEFLRAVIREERKRWESFMFSILSLLYGEDRISIVRENISEGKMESTAYALEIVRELVSDSIKPVLSIILDDLPVKKKLKKLSEYYPAEVAEHNNISEDIINRDYNLTCIWTKACTLRDMGKIVGKESEESVVALLFSPEEIIREEAAYLIGRSNPGLYFSTSDRISVHVKRKLDQIVNGVFNKNELLFEKVNFLKEYFDGIPTWELFTLAGNLQLLQANENDSFVSDCIIWILNEDQSISDVHIIYPVETPNSGVSKSDPGVSKSDPGVSKSDPGVSTSNPGVSTSDMGKETPKLGVSTERFIYRLPLASFEEFLFQYPEHSQLLLEYADKI